MAGVSTRDLADTVGVRSLGALETVEAWERQNGASYGAAWDLQVTSSSIQMGSPPRACSEGVDRSDEARWA